MTPQTFAPWATIPPKAITIMITATITAKDTKAMESAQTHLDLLTDSGALVRAMIGVTALSLGAAPVGVFLLLRRMSLMGDIMAHAILPGAALGFMLAGSSLVAMTFGGLLAGLVVAVLAGWSARAGLLREDATLALFYLLALASGVLILSAQGQDEELLHLLFGSVAGLDGPGLVLMATMSSLALIGLALVLRPLVLDSLDPGLARMGRKGVTLAHLVFLVLVVLALVAGYRSLGTLLSAGVMILPAAAARCWAKDLTPMLGLALVFALATTLPGVVLAYLYHLPSGPVIVLLLGAVTLASLLLGRGGILTRARTVAHLGG